MKIYTKNGDKGTTIINGETISKDSCLTKTMGAFDSLQSALDRVTYGLDLLPEMGRHLGECSVIRVNLNHIISEVMDIPCSGIDIDDIEELELLIDEMNVEIDHFVSFGNPVAMDINEARVRTRKLERKLVGAYNENVINDSSYKYVNRLSDYLFVLAVYIERKFE